MKSKAMMLWTGFGAVLAIMAAYGLVLQLSNPDRFANCRTSRVAGNLHIGAPFELVSETGELMTEKEVIDRPTLLYFGYTFCPDICPFDTARNGDVAYMLEDEGKDLRTVFITVDPKRDTPEVLASFTDNMHPDMIGLTGSEDAVHQAAQGYRVYFQTRNTSDPYYLVDHSAYSYLALPEEGVVEVFHRQVQADEMAETIGCFIDRAA